MQRTIFLFSILFCITFTGWGQSSQDYTTPQILKAAENIMSNNSLCALITHSNQGYPTARMMDAALSFPDFIVWMATNPSSTKVQEIIDDHRVALYFSDLSSPGYVNLAGKAELVNHTDTIALYWKNDWSPFYTSKTAEHVVLIKFTPIKMEVVSYQDSVISQSYQWKAPAYHFEK